MQRSWTATAHSFLDAYAATLNDQLLPLAKSPSPRVRLLAAITLSRVATNAKNGRLADATAHRRLLGHEAVPQQSVDDEGRGLSAEPGETRNIGFGQSTVQANSLQDDTLVELAHAEVVGAHRPRE